MFGSKKKNEAHVQAVARVLCESRGKLIFLPYSVGNGGVTVWSGLITQISDDGKCRTVEILTEDGYGNSIKTSMKREDIEAALKPAN